MSTIKTTFLSGQIIKHYGVYRCACGTHEIFGVSGRVFPAAQCGKGEWILVHRAREEKFF
jgi:hypothetical protein